MDLIGRSRHLNLVIGVTGSVAAIKLDELISEIQSRFEHMVNICVIPTSNSLHFNPHFKAKYASMELCSRIELLKESAKDALNETASTSHVFGFIDEDEWDSWSGRNDPVLHIELRKWADILLIAPLDANTLAKISNGLCDNLLTCLIRAWDFGSRTNATTNTKTIMVCPAMNTYMYEHPFTKKQLDTLANELVIHIVPPVEKRLMCGDLGIGAMASPSSICDHLDTFFKLHSDNFTTKTS